MRNALSIVAFFTLLNSFGQITKLNSGTNEDLTFLSVIGNNILIGGQSNNYLVKSYNQGKQLIQLPCPGPAINFNGFQRLDTNNIYLVSNGNGSNLYRSYNGGNNWNFKYYSAYGLGAVFFDSLEAIAMIDLYSQQLRTKNGGVAWTTSTNAPVWTTTCNKTFGDSTIIWGGICSNFLNCFFVSKDRGNTWPYAWGMAGTPTDFAFLNKDTIVGISYPLGNTDPNCMFTKSTDGGVTWKNKQAPMEYPNRVVFKSNNECYVIGKDKGYASISKTTDLGESWFIYRTNIAATLINMAILNDSVALLTGTAGTLLHWNFKRTVFTSIQPYSGASLEISIYPNPAGDNVTVECKDKMTMKVFNFLGTECASYSLEQGKNNIPLSTMPKGVYLCRFENLQNSFFYKIIHK